MKTIFGLPVVDNESLGKSDGLTLKPLNSKKRFPLKQLPFDGKMKISLDGVLDRAAEQCKRSRDNKHLAFPLESLNKHIEHIRESESDDQALERLEEFLRLWT